MRIFEILPHIGMIKEMAKYANAMEYDVMSDSIDMSLSKIRELVMRQGSLVCCSPWGHKESVMNEQLN